MSSSKYSKVDSEGLKGSKEGPSEEKSEQKHDAGEALAEPSEQTGLQSEDEEATEEVEERAQSGDKSCGSRCHGCLSWMNSLPFYVYSSQALSAWGDRMWAFAVALYLVEIEDNSLRLTALFGFCLTAAVFFFGAAVGRWVDKTSRLVAVQISLVLQNTFVMINAGVLVMIILTKDQILPIWGGALFIILQVLVILLGTIARLASLAQNISVQRDWVVVIAGNDRAKLAEMNAFIRRIDLSVNILAPIAVGQIMTFGSMLISGVFIAVWNLFSMIVEYFLLWKVYVSVPDLAVKANPAPAQGQSGNSSSSRWNPFAQLSNWFSTTVKGFKIYGSYDVFWTGLALAFLYMTVMGFDSVTNGYGYSLGVEEYMLGIIRALGSLAGIAGTLMFTRLRNGVGLERTGIYSLCIEIFFLLLCVASIWAPGSPFDPHFLSTRRMLTNNNTEIPSNEYVNEEVETVIYETETPFTTTPSSGQNLGPQCLVQAGDNDEGAWSAALFFAGMVFSRIGLWAFDLTSTQQFQENVVESERGVFNGVQNSLQCSFDMLHFILVILLPCPESFGYLILVSMVFICTGAMSYFVYSYKVRGHLLPNFFKKCSKNYTAVRTNQSDPAENQAV